MNLIRYIIFNCSLEGIMIQKTMSLINGDLHVRKLLTAMQYELQLTYSQKENSKYACICMII